MCSEQLTLFGVKLNEYDGVIHCSKYHGKNCTRSKCLSFSFYSVPIYNPRYFDCANFPVGNNFPIKDFTLKVLDIACKSDGYSTKNLRRITSSLYTSSILSSSSSSLSQRSSLILPLPRFRKIVDYNVIPAAFLKNIDNLEYKQLFCQCFTKNEKEMFELNFSKYSVKKNKRDIVIFEIGYGVNKHKIYTLYTLLNLYTKFFTIGVNNINDFYAPWHKESIMEQNGVKFRSKKGKRKCLDNNDKCNVYEKQKMNLFDGNHNIKIKEEVYNSNDSYE